MSLTKREMESSWFLDNAMPEIPDDYDPTTAQLLPEPTDIGGNEISDRIEANEDWYEVERNDFDRGDLRDEGRNPDGSGLSYGERNA